MFVSTVDFNGTVFPYRAVDSNGLADPEAAIVTLAPGQAPETTGALENIPLGAETVIVGLTTRMGALIPMVRSSSSACLLPLRIRLPLWY